jgi:hypothetical protein
MDFLFSVFFGAGLAAFTYSKMGRRLGYGNTGNVALVVGVVFIIASIVFFSILKTLHIK